MKFRQLYLLPNTLICIVDYNFAMKQLKNQRLTTAKNVPTSVTFNVDEGLGTNTTVTVVSKEINDIDILLTGPNDYTQQLTGVQVRTLSIVIPRISEVRVNQFNLKIIIISPTSRKLRRHIASGLSVRRCICVCFPPVGFAVHTSETMHYKVSKFHICNHGQKI